MDTKKYWRYGNFSVPAQSGITFHEDSGQVFLADDNERYTIALDEIIKKNCKGRTIRSSYPKPAIVLSLFNTQSDEQSFAFFQIEPIDANAKIEPIYGQIVFNDMTAKDGLHLDELQKMFSEIIVTAD